MRTTARSSRGSAEWPGHIASEEYDSLAQGSLAAGEEGSQRPGGARTRSASAQLVGSPPPLSTHRVVRQRIDDRDVGGADARGGLRRTRDPLMRWIAVDAVLHPVFAEWVSYSQQSLPSRGWQVV